MQRLVSICQLADQFGRGVRRIVELPEIANLSIPSAFSNRRLISLDDNGVTFRFKDYRRDGAARYGTMTLTTDEFIRRFLLHVLPKGFHRIRHYGLLATGARQANLARARALLGIAPPAAPVEPEQPPDPRPPCPCCGGHMVVLETLPRWLPPRGPPPTRPPTGRLTP